jgi:hypothetical protein
MVRSHKAIAGASPLSQAPTEPRTHRHDGKKGQQHKAAAAAAVASGGGGLVSPAGSSRYLLTSSRFASVTQEIQEVEAAPAVDAKREEAGEAADAKSAPAQEQVRSSRVLTPLVVLWIITEH